MTDAQTERLIAAVERLVAVLERGQSPLTFGIGPMLPLQPREVWGVWGPCYPGTTTPMAR
jgi:hypothetical protein